MKTLSRRTFLAGTAASGLALSLPTEAAPVNIPKKWDLEADIGVIGAGATGLPAAIGAKDRGFSVLVVDANYDIGGHAMIRTLTATF